MPPPKHSGPTSRREKQVGQFVLGKTLGEGTFGEVKLAMHKPTSERVAAKVCGCWRVKKVLDCVEYSKMYMSVGRRTNCPSFIRIST